MDLFNRQLLSALAFVLLCSCGSEVPAQNSVEKEKPSAAYSPAFVGQTRIKAVKTSTP